MTAVMTPGFEIMFPIFITTLGPLKVIPVFYALTRNSPLRYRAELAARAAIEASLVVGFVALVASSKMEQLHISHDAVAIAGGIILFVSALRAISSFTLADLPPPTPEDLVPPRLSWMERPTLSPLAVPTIVTPGGVVAILFFLSRAGENGISQANVALMLGLMMLADLAGMLLATPIMKIVRLAPLQVTGWVFAVLQAGMAVQAILNALERLKVVP
jgi:multiple antibiotic resistance protein